MNLGKITVITPPDKLFNMTLGYLLVKPSVYVKQQFQAILSKSIDDINVFIFDEEENDIETKEFVKEFQIDTDFELLFPDEYINNITERLSLYNELGSVKNNSELEAYEKRLIDEQKQKTTFA